MRLVGRVRPKSVLLAIVTCACLAGLYVLHLGSPETAVRSDLCCVYVPTYIYTRVCVIIVDMLARRHTP